MPNGSDPWESRGQRPIRDFGIFKATEVERAGPHGKTGRFVVLDAPDWGVVVPVLERDGERYVLAVRQFRHGSGRASLEFPGGVVEPGEDPERAAARELREETGYAAGSLTLLGDLSPNPAILTNRFRVYLAEDLRLEGSQRLDEHEIVDVQEVPEADFLDRLGGPGWDHALMSAAAFLYVRRRGRESMRAGSGG
jgi:8-oxo-dGTP pyrophosphatase MutT (NUDIX family)